MGNMEWIFSGIGAAVFSGAVAFFVNQRKKDQPEKKPKTGKTQEIHSNTQIYIQNNYYISEPKEENED